MSKTRRPNHRRGNRGMRKADRHITVSSVRRDPPDLRKLSRAVIALTQSRATIDAGEASDTLEAERAVPQADAGRDEATEVQS